jgi:hypothetical protein
MTQGIESVAGGGASGGVLVIAEVESVIDGVMQVRLADGTDVGITTVSGAPFPAGAEGGTVSFQAVPASD